MKERPKIIGVGYCCLDYLCIVPHIPQNDKVEVVETLIQGGGPVATAMVAAARLGAATIFYGVVGDDEHGSRIVSGLKAGGVGVQGVKVRYKSSSATGFCWSEEHSGNRSIAWTRGTAQPLTQQEISKDEISRSDLLHLDGHQSCAALYAAHCARQHGVMVSLDAGTLTQDIDKLLELSDIIIASEQFTVEYTGLGAGTRALRKLFDRGCRFAAITLGKRGALGFDGSEFIRCPALKVPVIKDTTGAGDVFHGAFAVAAARGWPWGKCMKLASVAAALKCEQLGGRSGIPTLDEAQRHMRQLTIQTTKQKHVNKGEP